MLIEPASLSTADGKSTDQDNLGSKIPPTPSFDSLPPEIRDQIYHYLFLSPEPIYPLEPPPAIANKCLSSHLLRINKQANRDGSRVLYGQNTFAFMLPMDLLAFEVAIGPHNISVIQNLLVPIRIPEPLHLDHCDTWIWQPRFKPSHYWAKALHLSRLGSVTSLMVTSVGETFCLETIRSGMKMPPLLVRAIQEFLERPKHKPKAPSLKLVGFAENEKRKFPSNWTIVIIHEHVTDFTASAWSRANPEKSRFSFTVQIDDPFWPALRDSEFK